MIGDLATGLTVVVNYLTIKPVLDQYSNVFNPKCLGLVSLLRKDCGKAPFNERSYAENVQISSVRTWWLKLTVPQPIDLQWFTVWYRSDQRVPLSNLPTSL